jgi:hypothetical protein
MQQTMGMGRSRFNYHHHLVLFQLFYLLTNTQVNVMGLEKEKIQQSYSFKRLMADVLGETDF